MARLERNKLNHLSAHAPEGGVLTIDWLRQQGISPKLAWWYVHSNWLERLGDGAYKKVGDNPSWPGAIAAIQEQLHLAIHVGGKTSLELLGQSHFVPMGGIKQIILFSSTATKIPSWLQANRTWQVSFKLHAASLFLEDDVSFWLIKKSVNGVNILLSSPERAIFELLYLVPHKQSFEEACLVMEGLRQLRPTVIQQLLEKCKSIKVKRLFLHLAETFQHPWLTELDLKKINLGKGKRVIGNGGNYNSKYQISVPKITED